MGFGNIQDIAWRPLGDSTLIVSRTSNRLWHLNPAGTRLRQVDDLEECVAPIRLATTGIIRPIGSGLLWCAPDGQLAKTV